MLMHMLFARLIFLASLVAAQEGQVPLQRHESPQHHPPSTLRVAIIGAGAAGSSAAYHLRNYSHSHPELSVNITIFESTPRIGGRTTTVNALDNPQYPTELGASIFVKVNHILYNAANALNLTIANLEDRDVVSDYSIGVWDGSAFVLRQAASSSWWDMAKLLWRYGLAPFRTQSLMKSTTGRFFRMYDEPTFPFESLDVAAARVGLVDFTAATGAQILKQGGVSEKFGREIVQASTRVNYGQNLGGIHGLETMVCMATDGAMAIEGGNWQIFEAMVKASGADVRLESTVQTISKTENGAYAIKTARNALLGDISKPLKPDHDEFDTIILATPLQFSNISFSPPLTHPPDEIPYVTLHVTLFTSPHRLSPSFFHLDPSTTSANEIPDMVLTTLPEGLDLGARRGKDGVGPAGFWSISLLRKIELDADADSAAPTPQYLYKVFSPEKLTATWLARLLGLPDHDHHLDLDPDPLSTTSPEKEEQSRDSSSSVVADPIARLRAHDVTWSHEKVWASYPYELPRLTFERIRLDGDASRGIWYTPGIESFISTMETSALMGKNVARLIVDELLVRDAFFGYEKCPVIDHGRLEGGAGGVTMAREVLCPDPSI